MTERSTMDRYADIVREIRAKARRYVPAGSADDQYIDHMSELLIWCFSDIEEHGWHKRPEAV